jgi:hypothetical protein
MIELVRLNNATAHQQTMMKMRREINWILKRMKMRNHLEMLVAFACSMKPLQELLFCSVLIFQ